jgi:hypothetical protein
LEKEQANDLERIIMLEKNKANGDDLSNALSTVRCDIESFVERLKNDAFARSRN